MRAGFSHADRASFVKGVADYVETHAGWSEMTKREAAEAAVRVLTEDIGAAQSFLQVIGVPYDLYNARGSARS